ncbi:HlyD family efflux transporter periplasmic adaptor subunit [Sphingomonas sp. XXL09]|uniref:HlyD family efflux transporter periplasmic adaptor subunit n=1 Tax=Sphingomonas sp. XXL09 TaxID=3457787 RepID=UPI00406BA132
MSEGERAHDQGAGDGHDQDHAGDKRPDSDKTNDRDRSGKGGDDESGEDKGGDAKSGGDRDGENGEGDGDDQDGDKKKPSIFKKPLFWIILIVVVATLVIGGTLYYLHARQFESTDDAFVDTHIVRISAQSAGRLIQVADLDNRHVEAGRLLAVIEPSGPEAQLAEARANVVQSQAQVQQALAQVSAAIANREQAAAAARAPLAAAEKARNDLARYEALLRLDPSAVAGQQLDQARAQARSTASDAAAARRQVDAAEAQVTVATRQVKSAEAVVGARKAQVSQANTTLGDLQVKAPVPGQVVNRQVNLGSYVQPGSQLLAIVPDRMWVTANFKETQLTLMRIGQAVTIKVDAYPDVEFHGHVDSIQRGAGQAFAVLPPQNATGNYVKVVQRVPVRIEFDHRDGDPDPRRYPIGPGMSVVPTVKVR